MPKGGAMDRPDLRSMAPVLDPTKILKATVHRRSGGIGLDKLAAASHVFSETQVNMGRSVAGLAQQNVRIFNRSCQVSTAPFFAR